MTRMALGRSPHAGLALILPALSGGSVVAQSPPIDRTSLPIAEPDYPHETELDARKAKAPPRFEVKAPKGAPNVIVFLIDDIGFGHAERVRRRASPCRRSIVSPARASSTTGSTPRRCARPRAWPS